MVVPYGIIADVCAVALGGVIGGLLKKVLPKRLIDASFLVFAFCAVCIGIISVIKLDSLTVVMVSVILGCVIGELCCIESGIQKLIRFTVGKLNRKKISALDSLEGEEKEKAQSELDFQVEMLCLSISIICFSGTGIYGALNEGLDGDHSVLFAKAVLDFFTVLIIAAQIGMTVSVFALPQAVVFLICYFIATLISPILTDAAIANFKSVGGVLTMIVGYNMLASQLNLKKVRVLNLLPAFILVFFFSWVVTFLPFTV